MNSEPLYQIALTHVEGVGTITARHLLSKLGSAQAVFEESEQSLQTIDGIGSHTANRIKAKEPLLRAEKELSFVEKNKIALYFITDSAYPYRLRECSDAPVLFYYKGNGSLERQKVVSIIGTRKATDYGAGRVNDLMADLAARFPDLLVVSGLAYGIDILTHRAALAHRLPTVGVLAHGLDRIYPAQHRKTAVEMLEQGGLLTEFASGNDPERYNFVMRNRIVAGLADAVVVVESATKGGSLITAEIANSYNREVCAFPGRTTDIRSCGCNQLIKRNKAALIEQADDLIQLMNWDIEVKRKTIDGVQRSLFDDLTTDEERVVNVLQQGETFHIDEISSRTALPIYQLSSLLLDLEFKGVVKPLPGSSYKLSGR